VSANSSSPLSEQSFAEYMPTRLSDKVAEKTALRVNQVTPAAEELTHKLKPAEPSALIAVGRHRCVIRSGSDWLTAPGLLP